MERIIKSKYLSADEFYEMSGIDLNAVLKDDFNPSTKADRFIIDRENELETFVLANYHKSVKKFWECKTNDFQKEHFKRAIMYQCKYVLINGDIANDSGFDFDEGVKAKQVDLYTKSISRQAIDELRICGLANRTISFGSLFNYYDGIY